MDYQTLAVKSNEPDLDNATVAVLNCEYVSIARKLKELYGEYTGVAKDADAIVNTENEALSDSEFHESLPVVTVEAAEEARLV